MKKQSLLAWVVFAFMAALPQVYAQGENGGGGGSGCVNEPLFNSGGEYRGCAVSHSGLEEIPALFNSRELTLQGCQTFCSAMNHKSDSIPLRGKGDGEWLLWDREIQQ